MESMERCIGECGRRSAEYGEYIDTGLSPPVVHLHCALCCQNRKHPGGGGKIGVLLSADKSLLKAVTSVKK